MTLHPSFGMAPPPTREQAPQGAASGRAQAFSTDKGSVRPGPQPVTPHLRTPRLAAALRQIENRLASHGQSETAAARTLGTTTGGRNDGPVASEDRMDRSAEAPGRLASSLVRLEQQAEGSSGSSGLGVGGNAGVWSAEQPPASPVVTHPAHASIKSPSTCSQLAVQLLEQFPLERPAVVLLTCSVPEEATGAAVLALAQGLVAQVAGQVLVVDLSGHFARDGQPDQWIGAPALRGGTTTQSKETDRSIRAAAPRAWEPDSLLPEQERLDHHALRTQPERLSVLSHTQLGLDRAGPTDRWFWAELLGKLRQTYRLVLIWAGAVDTPEAQQIAPCADATYLMIHLGRTGRRATRRAIRLLERTNARLLGCLAVAETG